MPVYNEEESLGEVLDRLLQTIDDGEIVVVDDGSTDKSLLIATNRGVKIVKHAINMGYGAAVKDGIKNAAEDLIVIIDGDGTYPVEDIPKLLSHCHESDMVVGARIGKIVEDSRGRKLAKRFLLWLANYLSGAKILDINSGLRVFRKHDVMNFFEILPSGFSFLATLTLAYHGTGKTVKYVPINYYKRRGKSKINPLRDGIMLLLSIVRTAARFNFVRVCTRLSVPILLFIIVLIILPLW